jgi:hypothetical protein
MNVEVEPLGGGRDPGKGGGSINCSNEEVNIIKE